MAGEARRVHQGQIRRLPHVLCSLAQHRAKTIAILFQLATRSATSSKRSKDS